MDIAHPRQYQWLFLVPLKGGRWHIIPQLAVYTTYIPLIYCLLGGPICYRSHLLREPETTIDNMEGIPKHRLLKSRWVSLGTWQMATCKLPGRNGPDPTTWVAILIGILLFGTLLQVGWWHVMTKFDCRTTRHRTSCRQFQMWVLHDCKGPSSQCLCPNIISQNNENRREGITGSEHSEVTGIPLQKKRWHFFCYFLPNWQNEHVFLHRNLDGHGARVGGFCWFSFQPTIAECFGRINALLAQQPIPPPETSGGLFGGVGWGYECRKNMPTWICLKRS